MLAKSSGALSPAWIASRMFCTSAPGWVRCRTGWAGHYPPVTAGNTHCDLLRWFDQLDEHPTGVLGVDEVDPRVGRATPRLVVQQAHPALAQDAPVVRRAAAWHVRLADQLHPPQGRRWGARRAGRTSEVGHSGCCPLLPVG